MTLDGALGASELVRSRKGERLGNRANRTQSRRDANPATSLECSPKAPKCPQPLARHQASRRNLPKCSPTTSTYPKQILTTRSPSDESATTCPKGFPKTGSYVKEFAKRFPLDHNLIPPDQIVLRILYSVESTEQKPDLVPPRPSRPPKSDA